jgi:two-component system, response regulator FlrC
MSSPRMPSPSDTSVPRRQLVLPLAQSDIVQAQDTPVVGSVHSQLLFDLARRIAPSSASVLIEGATGTGKEVVAQEIHRSSRRNANAFVAVNCGALPEHLVEALLFGHERGAFTGASHSAKGYFRAAERGTLFLDEVGELPLHVQAKLLRVLQEREVTPVGATAAVAVDVRIVAATNRNLAEEVAEGRFREDLYYRLNVVPLRILPLRERLEDIRPLVTALMARHFGGGKLSDAAYEKLLGHDWPGNVRELENVLLRAQAVAGRNLLDAADIQFLQRPRSRSTAVSVALTLDDMVKQREFEAIRAVLDETRGRRTAAAARLGISERTLRYRLAEMAKTSSRSLQ